MAAPASAANPCLAAILLVIQSRSGSGARLVFHYPPEPLSADEDAAGNEELGSPNEDASSSSSNEDSSSEEEVHTLRPSYGRLGRQHNGRAAVLTTEDEDDQEHSKGSQQHNEDRWMPAWEPLLGLGSSGLAGLLAVGRIWHKRKFELGINNLCFVGWPVFVREDGHWQRQKTRKAARSNNLHQEKPADGDVADQKGENGADKAAEDSTDTEDTSSSSKKSQLIMFNLVFVLDPPTLESDVRVREMYQNVVKKFMRSLKHEQTRGDFVWKESEVIQAIKSRHQAQHSSAKSLYNELLSKSTLASAIASVYRAISTSRIASLNLSASTSIILQIPPVASISVLPSLTDPPVPAGLWLTTFNDATPSSSEVEGLAAASTTQLAKHITLLLKETPQRIIKDAQVTGGPLAAHLTKFVEAVKPTKSFHKIATASQIPWRDIQLFASHLITWRRAMVIPPLHQRDTYVVSPNADMSKFKSACKAYNAAFPTLPGLATILGALSGIPKPWMTLIPSSDHKEAYYEILAWLMKGGWVTQLRTFAYVRVSPEVKKAVREQEKKERLEKKASETIAKSTEKDDEEENVDANADADENGDTISNGNVNPRSFASDTNSQGSRRPSLISRPSSDQRQHIMSSKAAHDPNAASLILNPSRASPLESKWLDHIANSLVTTQYSPAVLLVEEREELRMYWLRFVKYFNGSEPLEFIPVREGLKRKFVWDLLEKMGLDFDGGVETEGGRDRAGGKGKILVTIRHW
jgi:nitrogen permease regulator 3-like protein